MADESIKDGTNQDKPADKGNGVSLSDIIAKEKALEAANAKLAALEAKEKDRLANEKKRAEMDADGAKKALIEQEARAAELEARIKAYEQRNIERAEKSIASLSDEDKSRVLRYREKMSTEDWVSFAEEEAGRLATPTTATKSAPPFGSPVDKGALHQGGKMKLSELGQKMLEDVVGDHDKVLEILGTTQKVDDKTNERVTVFAAPIQKAFGAMKRQRAKNLSREEVLRNSRS